MTFKFSRYVADDLISIATYIRKDSDLQAGRMLARIEDEIDRIRMAPQHYQARPEIGPGARSAVIGRYLILFTVSPDQTRIERIVHGTRNLPTLFHDAVKNG